MRTRKRIHPYVTPHLAHRLTTYCAAKGITESAAVQTAVEDHLDGEAKDNELILRRLDRLGRESLGHQRDLAVLTESFSIFVRMCFAYLPPVVESEKLAADRLGGKRYLYLVDLVAKQMATGPGLVANIAKNPPSGTVVSAGTPPAAPAAAEHRDGQR
jgi:hypothetical protein